MVFIAGWIMQVVIIFGYPYTPDYYRDVVAGTVIFTLLPWYGPSTLHRDPLYLMLHFGISQSFQVPHRVPSRSP